MYAILPAISKFKKYISNAVNSGMKAFNVVVKLKEAMLKLQYLSGKISKVEYLKNLSKEAHDCFCRGICFN